MQNSIKVFALAALSISIFSCAKEDSVSSRVLEDRIIKAYVAKNGITTQPTASGLYLDIVKEGTGETPAITDWVMLKFTGQSLNGNYFHTTDSALFQNMGYNVNYFHIVPDFLYMAGSMPQGIREALLTMKEGSKANILMPSYIGFGQYGAVMFGQMPLIPSASVQAYTPVKYELELVKVIKEPAVYDSLLVDSFVKKAENASYTKVENNLYMRILTPGSTDKKDTIGTGTTVKVHYAGYFLDGYCFDTNIKSLNDTFAPYKPYVSTSTDDTLSVSMTSSGSGVVKGWDVALRKLTAGAKAELVFTSSLGYSTSGSTGSNGKPSIAPYSPLKFYIEVNRVVNPTSTTTKSASKKPANLYSLRKN